MIEEIKHNDQVLAIIIGKNYHKDGISFITPDDFTLQLGYMSHPAGYKIKPHMHHPVKRETIGTQEVLIIKEGVLKIDFYSQEKEYVDSRTLCKGDVILLISGGHGMTVIEPVTMIETKNGPYLQEQDKEKFKGIDNDTC